MAKKAEGINHSPIFEITEVYKRYRGDVIEAGISENKVKTWDKMSGYKEN